MVIHSGEWLIHHSISVHTSGDRPIGFRLRIERQRLFGSLQQQVNVRKSITFLPLPGRREDYRQQRVHRRKL